MKKNIKFNYGVKNDCNKTDEEKEDDEDNDNYDIVDVNYDAALDKLTTPNNSLFKQTKSYSPCGSLTLLDSINILDSNAKCYDACKNNQIKKSIKRKSLSSIESLEKIDSKL
jgi:hypothetical protein